MLSKEENPPWGLVWLVTDTVLDDSRWSNGTGMVMALFFARRIEWILLEDAKLQKPNCTRPVSHGSVLKGSVFQSQWVCHSRLPFGPCLPFPGPQDSSSGSLSQILRMAKGRCFSHGFLVLWPSLKTQPRCEWWVQNHTGHGRRHPVTGNPLQPPLRQEILIFPHLSGEDKAGKDCPKFAILTWREKIQIQNHSCYIFFHIFSYFFLKTSYIVVDERWSEHGLKRGFATGSKATLGGGA